jgi:hypothetical protein
MKKIGIGIDYSNICKDYNTAYLDRDNKDPATSKCMKQVVAWTNTFISELLENFDYNIYKLNSDVSVKIDEVASNRFLFYSLEKEITLQNYVLQKEYVEYESVSSWINEENDGVLIQNDEDGEGIYLYFTENSPTHLLINDALKDFSIDEAPLPTK